MWIFNFPPLTVVVFPTEAEAVGAAGVAAADAFASWTLSTQSFVMAFKESRVFVRVEPIACPMVKAPSSFKSPDDTRSSKIAGSSKS